MDKFTILYNGDLMFGEEKMGNIGLSNRDRGILLGFLKEAYDKGYVDATKKCNELMDDAIDRSLRGE